jgi:ectoine hydroxylase-related dioxygenase (phytanoyl-CoA dioxygenase family)
MLHRDEAAWSFFVAGKPELTVESMIALSDFTEANGATRIAPGSHRWDAAREPSGSELAVAAMPAGSAVVYLGSTLHGGGANRTEGEARRGLFLGYVLGWLRTEENSYLTTPIEAVREMPHLAQALLGYEAHQAIGVVDVGSPMKMLRG